MPLQLHGLDHTQGGQRIDEAGGAVPGVGSLGQEQGVGGADTAILGVHLAAQDGHGAAQQGLGLGGGAGSHDFACALVAGGQGGARAGGHGPAQGRRDGRGQDGGFTRSGDRGGLQVCGSDQQAQVRGVDRRGADPHQDLAIARLRRRDSRQGQAQLGGVGGDFGAELEEGFGNGRGHVQASLDTAKGNAHLSGGYVNPRCRGGRPGRALRRLRPGGPGRRRRHRPPLAGAGAGRP